MLTWIWPTSGLARWSRWASRYYGAGGGPAPHLPVQRTPCVATSPRHPQQKSHLWASPVLRVKFSIRFGVSTDTGCEGETSGEWRVKEVVFRQQRDCVRAVAGAQ